MANGGADNFGFPFSFSGSSSTPSPNTPSNTGQRTRHATNACDPDERKISAPRSAPRAASPTNSRPPPTGRSTSPIISRSCWRFVAWKISRDWLAIPSSQSFIRFVATRSVSRSSQRSMPSTISVERSPLAVSGEVCDSGAASCAMASVNPATTSRTKAIRARMVASVFPQRKQCERNSRHFPRQNSMKFSGPTPARARPRPSAPHRCRRAGSVARPGTALPGRWR